MKNIILLLTLCLVTTSLFAQSEIATYIKKNKLSAKAEYGIHYVLGIAGTGQKIKKGDYVKINYEGKRLDGKTFDVSDSKEPFVFQVGYGQVIRGLDVGMTLLNKGCEAKLLIPADLAYGNKGVGTTIPPNASLLFEIEVLDIMNQNQYDDYMRDLEKKERQAFENHRKQQFDADLRLINKYASKKKIKAKRLPSGVSYAITKKGKGDFATAGDVLRVRYEGFLTDGSKFDASKAKAPYQFELGAQKVIEGWEEGLTQFNKGAEGWLLIPSKLAYGPRAIQEEGISIPANSILIFKIKVESLEKGVVQAKK